MAFWVYMLRCADNSYYVGHTDNLELRMSHHDAGDVPGYTSKRRPVTPVYSQEFPTREEALAAEQQIKKWSRLKKEALIKQDWTSLSRHARKDFSRRKA
jgi:predicted GIY-YIG superfamily endonuclease